MSGLRLATALAASAGLSALTGSAWAQEAAVNAPSLPPPPPGASPAAATAAVTAVGTVVVTAPRQAAVARLEQYEAPNLINVQSAETIAQYPDFNAAEALGRIPGVSLSTDTGEGRFVQIRGIDANLDGATYGGVVLLNTNPGGTAAGGGGRAVEFDTIPTGAIDGIIVTKTGLPDHEAEGLGGTVELSPRTANNIHKPFFEGQIGYGDEPLHGHSGPFDGEVAMGARFGVGGPHGFLLEGDGQDQPVRAGFFSNPTPFSLVLTASTRQDRRGIDDLEESYIDDGAAPGNAVSQYDLRRYDYHRRRYGYGGEFDFKPNDDHRYYARVDIAGYNEAVHKNFLLFKSLDGVEGPDGQIPVDPNDPKGYLVTTKPQTTLTDEQEAHRNQVYVVGGEDRFGQAVLDYHVAYSRATFRVNYNIGAKFSGPGGIPITYDNESNFSHPDFTFPAGTNFNNASMYKLSSLANNQDYDADEERTYAANLLFPLHLFNDSDRIKIGIQARIRDKVATEYDEDVANPAGGLNLANASSAGNTFYDGMYPNGPFINRYTIRGLVADNSGPPTFNYGSFFSADENIYAGYIQYSVQIGKLGILAGVRVEDTNGKYGGYVVDADGNPTGFQTVDKDYVNAFPTVQLRYAFTSRLIARATYSTGIGRPGFNQNTSASAVDDTQDPIAISHGNPNLKPTTGDNYDLDLEYYLPKGGIVSAGIFDKEFDNYIVTLLQNGVTTDPLSRGALANVTSYENISSAYARGIELDYHQQFVFLPSVLKGLGVDGNLTLVNSRIQEYPGEYGLLPGTSRVTYNAAVFYEAYGVTARLSSQYVSHSLFALGGDKSLDTIQDKRFTVDLTTAYQVTSNYGLYFNVKNLANTPLRYYEGDANRPIQREFYDVTYEGGFRVHF